MAFNVIVKNTFLDVDEQPAVGETRRCSSLPRMWKPGGCYEQSHDGGAIASDASVTSTSAPSSREAVSDTNSETGFDGFSPQSAVSVAAIADGTASGVDSGPEKCQDSPSMALQRSQTDSKPQVCQCGYPFEPDAAYCRQCGAKRQTLHANEAGPQFAFISPVPAAQQQGQCLRRLNPEAVLFQMPPYAGPSVQHHMQVPAGHTPLISSSGYGATTRLNPEARAFQPVVSPVSEEVNEVVGAAQAALRSNASITGVKVIKPAPGQTLTIVAEMANSKGQDPHAAREALAAAKAALLGAAANSQSSYILGYSEQPFKDFLDTGFRATIGVVPEEHQDTACWDTYQKGFCPRRATCRWSHPQDSDLTPIRVILKKPDAERVAA